MMGSWLLYLYLVKATNALPGVCGLTARVLTMPSPARLGVIFSQLSPPSRVMWTSPSSVPAHSVFAECGLWARYMMVLWFSLTSLVIGKPPGPWVSGSSRERSGLISAHEWPRSVDL